MTAPSELTLTFGTPAWTPGTRGRQIGPAILAPTSAEKLSAMEGQLAGKWVLETAEVVRARSPRRAPRRGRESGVQEGATVEGGDRGRERAAPEGTPSSARESDTTTARRFGELLDEAYTREGVLGIIRSTGSELVQTSGNWRISWEDLPSRVTINVIEPHWKKLMSALESDQIVELEFDIRNNFEQGPIPLYNVVADLKGTEKPDEFVIVGGHIDSWDGATGTTDNGTGTSTTIEAARILTAVGAKPKRTIRFMLWSGEEQGLLGSSAYCKANQELMARISGVLVHDMGTNYLSGIPATAHQFEDMERVFAPVKNLNKEMPFAVRKVSGLRGGGSDHGSFLALGVPGFFWDQKGRSVYRYGWHTQNDTFDIAIPEYQRHSATVIAIGAYGIANLENMLSREALRSTSEQIPTGRMLGVELVENTLVVGSVTTDSAAARGGVKPGDLLLEVDGLKLADRFALRRALNLGEPSKTMTVQRGEETVSIELTWPR